MSRRVASRRVVSRRVVSRRVASCRVCLSRRVASRHSGTQRGPEGTRFRPPCEGIPLTFSKVFRGIPRYSEVFRTSFRPSGPFKSVGFRTKTATAERYSTATEYPLIILERDMEGVGAFSVRRGGRVGGRFLLFVRPGYGRGGWLFGAEGWAGGWAFPFCLCARVSVCGRSL